MQVTIEVATTDLPRLIDVALSGEEVIVVRGSKPIVRLVPINATKFKIGVLAKELSGRSADFLERLSDEALDPWESVNDSHPNPIRT